MKNVIYLLSIFIFGSIQPHIFKVERWGKSGSNQEILLLSDYHVAKNKTNQVNDIQQKELTAFLKDRRGALIVEDMAIHDKKAFLHDPIAYDRNKAYSALYSQGKSPMIMGLTSQCHQENIPVYNAEVRFPESMNITLDVIGQNIQKVKQRLVENIALLPHDFNAVISSMLNTMQTHVERPASNLLNKLATCRVNVEEFTTPVKITQSLKNVWGVLWGEFFGTCDGMHPDRIAYDIVDGLEARLVDAHLVYGLGLHEENSMVAIAAGDAHIRRIKPALKKLGYTRMAVKASDVKYAQAKDAHPYEEPKAINLGSALKTITSIKKDIATELVIENSVHKPIIQINILHIIAVAIACALALYIIWRRNRTLALS